MTNVAIIPARGGSKGIAHKNLQSVVYQSLFRELQLHTSSVDLVLVSSDSEEILLEARRGARIVLTIFRPIPPVLIL